MEKAIYFDMDGTLNSFYAVPNWLEHLQAEHTKPYREAKSTVNMKKLSKALNALQQTGYTLGIVSWLSKGGTDHYNEAVTKAKRKWLKRHIGSVQWDEIHIVPYGTPKQEVVQYPKGILFDDEERNRSNWTGTAYDVMNMLEVLSTLE